MPKHMVGNLKPMKVIVRKAGHNAHTDFVTQKESFGLKMGNKIDVPRATASKTHSS